MSILINCQSLSKSHGDRTLFEDLSLSIFENDRVGLIGLNGCGKSTLLRILSGEENPDSGKIVNRNHLQVGYVAQEFIFPDLSVKEIVKKAAKGFVEDYESDRCAELMLQKLGFENFDLLANQLSGGWKKRLQIATQLIKNPDVLLLDEPTNHLDLEGILWLEKFLSKQRFTYLVISHDRYFLQKVTNKIIEIDKTYPNGVFSIDGSYKDFLFQKEQLLQGQLQQEKSIASKVRRESEWLKSNVKARTTKSGARIDEAEELINQYGEIKKRNQQKNIKIDFESTKRETKKLVVGKNISKKIKEKTLFKNLDFTLSPGTRIGLVGPNGSGKTTLLSILEEKTEPDSGTIKKAEDLKVVYFDQHRMKLPLHLTLKEALSPHSDFVTFKGSKIHVNSWCQRFLFSPDLLKFPIGKLSGGERARITIAHLMLQPADILLLDEPTNDLDIPTLETLEESLLEFPGAIVLITHDRCMIDRICNSILVLGNPEKTQVFSEYSQWESSNKPEQKKQPEKPKKDEKKPHSYAKKKQADKIERKITKLENEIHNQNLKLEDTEIANNPTKLSEICNQIKLLETQLTALYLEWEELS